MTLEWSQIIYILITAAFAVIGYFFTQFSNDQKKDRQMINDLRAILPERYVSKDDLTGHLNRIETMLTKIFDRLEQKADK